MFSVWAEWLLPSSVISSMFSAVHAGIPQRRRFFSSPVQVWARLCKWQDACWTVLPLSSLRAPLLWTGPSRCFTPSPLSAGVDFCSLGVSVGLVVTATLLDAQS